MARGLPKSIIKKYGVTKKAWAVYRGLKSKRKVYKRKRKSNPRGRIKVARRRRYYPRRRRSRRSKKIPLAPTMGLIGTIFSARHPWAAAGDTMMSKALRGDLQGAAADLPFAFSGVDPDGKFHMDRVIATWLPTIAGVAIHMIAAKTGLNRALARVPWINI